MIVDDFLARLKRVKKSGPRSWTARCPAHDDKGPSLKVTDADGKILIHCFALCEPYAIVSAVGLQLHDLFPPRNPAEQAQYRRERFTKDALKEMEREVRVALVVLEDVVQRRDLDPQHHIARAKRAKETLYKLLREISRAS